MGGEDAPVLLPELDDLEDLLRRMPCIDGGIGVAQHAGVGILGEECEDGLLAATPLGPVVLLEPGPLATGGGGMEVEVEALAGQQLQPRQGLDVALEQEFC